MSTYNILFLGDIVGRPGRTIVHQALPHLKEKYKPLFTLVNGENAAAGTGITASIAEDLFDWGVDVITLGNHAFDKKEIGPYIDQTPELIRPANMNLSTPGRGLTWVKKDDVILAVINLCGRVFMEFYDDPFKQIDQLLGDAQTPHIFIDFHGEATSEKIAMGWYIDGRATAIVGTHTHVTTADERVLPAGTAYITDVGMCGPKDSVIGVSKELSIKRFCSSVPVRFETSDNPGYVSGVVIEVDRSTGRAIKIERISYE